MSEHCGAVLDLGMGWHATCYRNLGHVGKHEGGRNGPPMTWEAASAPEEGGERDG